MSCETCSTDPNHLKIDLRYYRLKEIFEIFKSLATDILDLNNDIFKVI